MKTNNKVLTNEKCIPIFFSIDDNYAKFLAITLESLEEYASKEYSYNLIVLNTGLSFKTKKMLMKYNNDTFKVIFFDMNERLADLSIDFVLRDYYTKTTYFRLFIPSLFPEIDKAIYLDSDICVTSDISKMYEIEMGENYLAAVPDQSVQLIPEFLDYVERALGVKHDEYFNAGIIMMNMKKLREDDFEEKVLDLLDNYTFEVAQDQDILNTICNHKVLFLDSRYNQMPMGERISNPLIIHYNLSFKPWKLNDVMYEEVFYKYAVKANVMDEVLKMKKAFTDDMKALELERFEHLKEMCIAYANDPENYYNTEMKKESSSQFNGIEDYNEDDLWNLAKRGLK